MDIWLRNWRGIHHGLHSFVPFRRVCSDGKVDDHGWHLRLRIAIRRSRCGLAAPYPLHTAGADLRVVANGGKVQLRHLCVSLFLFLLIRGYLQSPAGSSIHFNFPERILLLLGAIVIVFVIAKLSYDLFESRFLRLKRYFNPAW